MKHLFVSFEIAKQLKDKGFDESCLAYHHSFHGFTLWNALDEANNYYRTNKQLGNDVAYPLYQQVIDWFREQHDLNIYLIPSFSQLQWCIKIYNYMYQKLEFNDIEPRSYYMALNKAIEEAIKLI